MRTHADFGARALDTMRITDNVAEFTSVPTLRVEDWPILEPTAPVALGSNSGPGCDSGSG
jgi:hypothetical protein